MKQKVGYVKTKWDYDQLIWAYKEHKAGRKLDVVAAELGKTRGGVNTMLYHLNFLLSHGPEGIDKKWDKNRVGVETRRSLLRAYDELRSGREQLKQEVVSSATNHQLTDIERAKTEAVKAVEEVDKNFNLLKDSMVEAAVKVAEYRALDKVQSLKEEIREKDQELREYHKVMEEARNDNLLHNLKSKFGLD